MIKVDERFEFERDTYGWKLHEWSEGVNPKTQKPTRTKRTTYHSSVEQVCKALLDRHVASANNIREVLYFLAQGEMRLIEAINEARLVGDE